jgi:hypothetical protein
MADDDGDDEALAVLEVIKAMLGVAQKYKLCPCCLIFNAASNVQEAVDEGRITHGPLDAVELVVDDEEPRINH